MKIRITQAGWAGYNGDFGAFAFVDGVSVDDIGTADAAYLAGLLNIENVDTGTSPSITQRMVDAQSDAAKPEIKVVLPAPNVLILRTKAELEAVADDFGIKGIRDISDLLGVKGNSISELIDKILIAESGLAATARTAQLAEEAKPAG